MPRADRELGEQEPTWKDSPRGRSKGTLPWAQRGGFYFIEMKHTPGEHSRYPWLFPNTVAELCTVSLFGIFSTPWRWGLSEMTEKLSSLRAARHLDKWLMSKATPYSCMLGIHSWINPTWLYWIPEQRTMNPVICDEATERITRTPASQVYLGLDLSDE